MESEVFKVILHSHTLGSNLTFLLCIILDDSPLIVENGLDYKIEMQHTTK